MKSASLAAESPYRVINGPVVTEKSTSHVQGEAEGGVAYVLDVAPGATKPQVRKAVEELFSVSVTSVRVVNVKGKPRNLRHRMGGARRGRKPLRRKAYVRLAEGESIDFWAFHEGAG